MSHFITKCQCGTVLGQCRCYSKDKIESIVPNGCPKCKAAAKQKTDQLAKAIQDTHEDQEVDQTAVTLKKLHKGEQDQLAVEIKKKHVNKE